MLNCKEIVRLANTPEPLPLLKRLELRFHLMMCRNCSNYVSQLKTISMAFKDLFSRPPGAPASDEKLRKLESDIIRAARKQ